jgi:hypothetical protein
MILYYLPQSTYNGQILYAIYDKDVFSSDLSTANQDYQEFTIDEVAPDNKPVCLDIAKTLNKEDVNGDGKYYIFDNAGVAELHEKDGWIEYNPYEGA